MSIRSDITRDHRWHVGEDKKLRFTIYADAQQTACVDVSGFAVSWKLGTAAGTTGTVSITKTSGNGIGVAGVFNADPALNTQVIEVTVDDVDTQPPSGDGVAPGTYYHELKRTDEGLEQILAKGTVTLLPAIHAS